MSGQLNYQDVEHYLRVFSAGESTCNFGALLRLVLAGIENLRQSVTEADIRENAHLITDAEAGFLQRLLEGRPDSIEWFKDDIAHSSQTGLL